MAIDQPQAVAAIGRRWLWHAQPGRLLGASTDAQRQPHFAPKAKRVIFLFMNGGPFQCDLFDPKPDLNRYAGQKPAGTDLRTERPTEH